MKVERNCKYLESASLHYLSKLKEVLLLEDLVKFNNYIEEVVTKLKCKMIKDNSKKLNNLILRKFGTLARYNVFNYSDRQLTEQEYFALSIGINFSLPPKHVDKELIFLGFECFYKQLCLLKPRSADKETATKVNLSSLAYNYSKSKPEKSSLLDFSEIRKVIKDLKNDNNLIITKPDKGNGCVLLNKSDYLGKMNNIMSDSTKFNLLGKATEVDNIDKVEI